MTTVQKERLLVFDFIRLFAILMVVFSHTLNIPSINLSYVGILGNVLFFFISGYLIYYNNSTISSKHDILRFYKKRVLRIYPLYIIAVLFWVLIYTVILSSADYSIAEIVLSILGLQMVAGPVWISTDPVILWFIGMILIFYLLYPVILYISKDNLMKFTIYSFIAIFLLAIIRVFTGYIGGGI